MNKKDLYQQKLQAQLDEWQAEIDKMKAKLGGASVGAKLEINQEINRLEGKLEEGRKKLNELSEASEENWEDLKTKIEKEWEEIADSFKSNVKEFLR